MIAAIPLLAGGVGLLVTILVIVVIVLLVVRLLGAL